ncbi:MAG: hypothetical protein ACREOO_26430 [bacterium]
MTTLKKLEELIYHGFKETDKKFQDTDRKFQENVAQFKETDIKLREWGKQLSGITDSLGLFAESAVKPAAGPLFAERGIKLNEFHSRVWYRHGSRMMEVDVLGLGPQHVVVVEVKLRLRQQDINVLLEKLSRFLEFFERYRSLTLYGAVAGMSIDQGIDRYAYQQGLFVLAQSGENLNLLNDENFVPRAYRFGVNT